jgi:hypothetical protein
MRTPVSTWTCATCPNTGTGTKPPYFIPDQEAPVPGTKVGVCESCYRGKPEAA